LLAVNGGIFWVIVKVLPGIESKGILPVLIAPIVFTTCSVALPRVVSQIDWNKVRVEATKLIGETRRFVGDSSQQQG
jgi:hypothetical protein